MDVDWLSWGADKAGFCSSESFRKFCAIGDVNPDAVVKWEPYEFALRKSPHYGYIWMSRAKDIVFEASANPLENERGYCHSFGLHGGAKKAEDMYQYMYKGGHQGERIYAEWAEMGWDRNWI